jgi:hypothetical protein
MGDYRAYKLDESGKTTGPPFIVRCEDDGTALMLVRQLADGQTREIWEGARRVAEANLGAPPGGSQGDA